MLASGSLLAVKRSFVRPARSIAITRNFTMSIPTIAKAIRIHEAGGPEVVKYEEVPVPHPAADEILIRNKYAGINFIELYVRRGLYPVEFPFTLGREAAGEVVKVGDKVTKYKVGDKVAYLGTVGAYGEYSAIGESKHILKIPENLSEKVLAASLLQLLTAHSLVREAYEIKKGDYVLVHAAAGGTGALIVQLAKLYGAHVIGTTSSPEKAAIAKAAGADHVINYRNEDVPSRVKEITGGKGVAGVYDGVGKDTWDVSLAAVARKGTIVSFGNASGAVPPVSLLSLTPKSVKVIRPTLFAFIEEPEEWQAYVDHLIKYLTVDNIKVEVSKVYPLAEAGTALTDIESGKTNGKLLIEI